MRENGLALAPDKSKGIIVQGRRRRENIAFTLKGMVLNPVKTLKHLGVTIAEKRSFGPHIMKVMAKAEKKGATLNRIIPNINGPSSNKRVILCGAIHNIVLYNKV